MSKRLTPELIAMRTKCDKLSAIKNLNLWGNDLGDITVIKDMPNLEVVSLSVNKIKTLKEFGCLKLLRELYLRKNLVSSMDEVAFLSKCPNLTTLWLNENPVADTQNYRLKVIRLIPQLNKLDDKVVTDEERELAESLLGDNNNRDRTTQLYGNEQSHSDDDYVGYSDNSDNYNVYGAGNNKDDLNFNVNVMRNDDRERDNHSHIYDKKQKNVMDKFVSQGRKSNIEDEEDMFNRFEKNLNIDKKNVIRRNNTTVNNYDHNTPQFNYRNPNEYDYENINQDSYMANINKRNEKPSVRLSNKERESTPTKSPINNIRKNGNENVFNSVLLLINELSESELETIRDAVIKKLNNY